MSPGESSVLMRCVQLAIDAGAEAEDATLSLVPHRSGRPAVGNLVTRLLLRNTTPPASNAGPDHARRACERLDEFAAQLRVVAGRVDDPNLVEAVRRASDWSAAVWKSDDNAAEVYNDVRSVIAMLSRYRVNLVLARSLNDQAPTLSCIRWPEPGS